MAVIWVGLARVKWCQNLKKLLLLWRWAGYPHL
ncbi:UNVERIFIED_CONTAM: hypothetical protein GTU68_065027 [Idotea baltica]|nr:hypothetical protein [Idotea baltica]